MKGNVGVRKSCGFVVGKEVWCQGGWKEKRGVKRKFVAGKEGAEQKKCARRWCEERKREREKEAKADGWKARLLPRSRTGWKRGWNEWNKDGRSQPSTPGSRPEATPSRQWAPESLARATLESRLLPLFCPPFLFTYTFSPSNSLSSSSSSSSSSTSSRRHRRRRRWRRWRRRRRRQGNKRKKGRENWEASVEVDGALLGFS